MISDLKRRVSDQEHLLLRQTGKRADDGIGEIVVDNRERIGRRGAERNQRCRQRRAAQIDGPVDDQVIELAGRDRAGDFDIQGIGAA